MALRSAAYRLYEILTTESHLKAKLFSKASKEEIQNIIRQGGDLEREEAINEVETKLESQTPRIRKPSQTISSWINIISKLINHKENVNE